MYLLWLFTYLFIYLFIYFIYSFYISWFYMYLFIDFSLSIDLFIYLQSRASSNFWNLIMTKSKRQHRTTPNCLTLRHSNFFSCSNPLCLPMNYDPSSKKLLALAAVLNTWRVTNFQKSSFYHTNRTFLTNINVWMMDSSSINARIKKIWSAQNSILCRTWLRQKPTFRHSEIAIFSPWQYPTSRAIGEPPVPSL